MTLHVQFDAAPQRMDVDFGQLHVISDNTKLDKMQGVENAGKLLYIGADGMIQPLRLGDGLSIVDGVLIVTGNRVKKAISGLFVCGDALCGEGV